MTEADSRDSHLPFQKRFRQNERPNEYPVTVCRYLSYGEPKEPAELLPLPEASCNHNAAHARTGLLNISHMSGKPRWRTLIEAPHGKSETGSCRTYLAPGPTKPGRGEQRVTENIVLDRGHRVRYGGIKNNIHFQSRATAVSAVPCSSPGLQQPSGTTNLNVLLRPFFMT